MSLNLLALQQSNEQNQTTTTSPPLNGSAIDPSSQAPPQVSSQQQQLFYLTFNQLNTHAAFATDRGFFVFNLLPSGVKVSSHKIFRKENSLSFFSEEEESELGSFIGAPPPAPAKAPQINLAAALQNGDVFDLYSWGGVGIIQFLNKTKFYGIVGGGAKPCFPTNRLVIWDDQSKSVAIDQFFAKPIRNLKLHSKIVVVIMEDSVCILTHELKPHPHYITPIETSKNSRGIFALSADDENVVLAIPGATKGSVKLEFIYSSKSATIPNAHESDIYCLAISKDGKKLATASEKGTLIRIWSTETLQMVKEVRRGSFKAEIHCIGFSDDNNYLCCYSSAGTLHLFNISNATAPGENRTSSFSLISYVVPVKFFANEWSCVEYKGIEGPAICAFGPDNKTVRVLTAKGKFYELVFDLLKGGDPMNVAVTDLLQQIQELK